jgi:pyruvate/2-oxoglutarate/acetoin dehydrogenase E1 component
MEPYLHHAPGLTVVVPGTPAHLAALLRASIRSPEPVVFLEHRRLYDLTGPVPDDPDFQVELGSATVVAPGEDLTLVAWGWMRQEAEAARVALEAEGISVELVDPRTIKPMDWATVLASVARTGRLLVAEEAPVTGSVAAEVLARAAEAGRLRAAARVTMPDVIHPYSVSMEAEILPSAAAIVAAALRLVGRRAS